MDRIGHNIPLRHYLKEWRTHKHLTQQQLADRLDTSKDQISRFENNQRKMTTIAASEFAEALGIDPFDIFHHPDTPSADALLRDTSPRIREQAVTVLKALLKIA